MLVNVQSFGSPRFARGGPFFLAGVFREEDAAMNFFTGFMRPRGYVFLYGGFPF